MPCCWHERKCSLAKAFLPLLIRKDYISKPIDPLLLSQTLKKYLNAKYAVVEVTSRPKAKKSMLGPGWPATAVQSTEQVVQSPIVKGMSPHRAPSPPPHDSKKKGSLARMHSFDHTNVQH